MESFGNSLQNESTELQERLFWPRLSETMDSFMEIITNEPEVHLSDEQKESVYEFERELFEGRFNNLNGPSLKRRVSKADTDFRVSPAFILTDQGRDVLGKLFNVEELPGFADESEVATFLRERPLEDYADLNVLKTLQNSSNKFLKESYVEAAINDQPKTINTIELSPDPNKLLENLRSLDDYRRFIRSVRHSLKSNDAHDPMNDAKLMITDIYRDKVTAKMAESLPILVGLIPQINALGNNAVDVTVVPSLLKAAKIAESDGDIHAQFMRMLDYVRNGAAVLPDGKLSPVDPDLYTIAEKVNRQNDIQVDDGEPIFSKSEIKRFEQYFFDASEMADFIDAYNTRLGIKAMGWQGEIRKDTDSFAIVGSAKKIKIPSSYNRSVAQTFPAVGVAGIINHEIGGTKPGHVWQSLNTERNGATLALGNNVKYRGKRYLGLREAGGVLAESDAMATYFGQTRHVNVSYAKAMDALLNGKTDAEAVRAFAESHLQGIENPSDKDAYDAYTLAADRTLRLLRFGGRNSQPLQYIEGAKVRDIASSLPEDTVSTMLGEAIFDPIDMMRLHKFGLLPTDTDHFFTPDEDPTAVMVELLRNKLDETKESTTENNGTN